MAPEPPNRGRGHTRFMVECCFTVGLAAGAVRARQAKFKANLVAKGRKTCPSRGIFGRARGVIGNGASSKVTEGWQEARSGRRGRRSHRTRGGGARRVGLAAALGRRDRRHSRCLVHLWSAAARLNERLQGEARAARPRPDVMVSRQARLEHRPARSLCSQPLLPNVSYPRRQPGARGAT